MCDIVHILIDINQTHRRKRELTHSRTMRISRDKKEIAFRWPCSRIFRGRVSASRSTWTLPRSSTLWIVPERTVCFPVYRTCLLCRVSLYCFMPSH